MSIPGGPLPTFSNLKQLYLQIDCEFEIDFVAVTTLLEACPVVCEFTLEISWCFTGDKISAEAFELEKLDRPGWWAELHDIMGDDDIEVGNVLVQQKIHADLKVLHVAGFNGCDADVD